MSSSAGVAIISSLPVREASWKSPSLQKLACDGRLIHATCAIAGSQPLHLVVFYGYASGTINPAVCQRNEEALTDITEECMSWGQVPVVLAGDFNVKIGDSLSLNNLLLYGRWVDAAAEHARRCGDLPPPPTCFKNPCSSKGTRIDGVFLSPSVAKGFLTLSYPASGLPTHQPLVVDLNVDPLKVFIVKHKTPRRAKLDPSFVRPSLEECAKHVEKLWRIIAPEWQRARNTRQVQALWPLLTRTCDSFYRWFAGLSSPKSSPCRGLPGSPSRVRVPPPRCRADDNATSVKNAACQRFVRALEHVARVRLLLAEDVTSSSRFHEFQHHWFRIVARAPRFVSTSLWTQLFGLSELRVSQPSSWPRYEHLVSLVRRLDSDAQLFVQNERSSRLALWRQSCRRKWRNPAERRFLYN